MDNEKATAESDCKPCDSGYYCGTIGLLTSVGTAPCQRGYFCFPAGQKVAAPIGKECPLGTQCPVGTSRDGGVPCANGTYANNLGMWLCLPCPEGFYCNVTDGSIIEPKICPAGSKCPAQTGTLNGVLCPLGTFQPEIGRHACVSCPAGQFCGQTGISG